MPRFNGTDQSDTIIPGYISPGVEADPAGSLPGGGNDTIRGNGGADTIDGGGGNDGIFGDQGADSLLGGAGFDNLGGGGGSDTLDGGAGNDQLSGGAGNDLVRGGAGNDYFYRDTGSDTLVGGTGDDTYLVGDEPVEIRELEGEGIDRVFSYSEAPMVLGDNLEWLTLYASASGTGNALDNRLQADRNAVLYGLAGDDTLMGIASTLVGGSGNDTYETGPGRSTTIVEAAGEGTDTLSIYFPWIPYAEQVYVIEDNVENALIYDDYDISGYGEHIYGRSTVIGNGAANLIQGGKGDNTISGQNGADTLYGNEGADSLEGGGGRDYLDGGDGRDAVIYTSNTTPVQVNLVTGLASFPGQDWAPETLVSIEDAIGGSGGDRFIGNSGANYFNGYDGNDVFVGGGGNDWLSGGRGNDTLDGGGGLDYLDGGAGVDLVLYTSNTTSVNLNLAESTASFPGQTWASETVAFVENAATGSGADTLIGSSVANVLRGMAGDDVLEGGGAADRLVGGAGNDVFVFTADASTPAARDTIAAGDGRTAFQGAGAAAGDRIDVSGLDADNGTAGMQDWVFGTSQAKGRLWVTTSGTQTIVNGNADDDAAVEFQVAIADGVLLASAYTADDFIL